MTINITALLLMAVTICEALAPMMSKITHIPATEN